MESFVLPTLTAATLDQFTAGSFSRRGNAKKGFRMMQLETFQLFTAFSCVYTGPTQDERCYHAAGRGARASWKVKNTDTHVDVHWMQAPCLAVLMFTLASCEYIWINYQIYCTWVSLACTCFSKHVSPGQLAQIQRRRTVCRFCEQNMSMDARDRRVLWSIQQDLQFDFEGLVTCCNWYFKIFVLQVSS